MKKIIFCVVVALALTRAAFPGEYREFTNQAGKSIDARIVQYDAKGERVQLELKNHERAWVQLSDLSEADQNYIRSLNNDAAKAASLEEKANLASEKAKDKPEPVIELSKKDLRAIGEQYIQAWNSGDIEKVKVLFLQPENVTQTELDRAKKMFQELNIDSVGDGYVVVLNRKLSDEHWMRWRDVPEEAWNQWLLLTADGKIKYDTSLYKHPIAIALRSMPVLYSRGDKYEKLRNAYYLSNKNSERAYEKIKDLGIPMFGLDLSRARYQIDKSLGKMTEWLMEEGDKWDSTEPKVFFPTELLNTYKESGKYDL